MKPATRKTIVGMLLMATLVAAIWPLPDEPERTSTTPRVSQSASNKGHPAGSTRSTAAEAGLHTLRPLTTLNAAITTPPGVPPKSIDGIAASNLNLFPSQTWTPPPPPQAASEAAPVAPPLPFGYGGRYVEAGQTVVFLTEGDRIYSKRVGDTINGGYRLDAIEPLAIRLTYLPLNISHSLNTGPMIP